jgi:hypothetical protein
MRRGPVLPVRFGTVFSGAQKLDEILSRGETAMGAGLDRVEGCVELGLHVLAPHPGGDAAAAANGREYMAARLAAERTRKQLQQGVHEALAPLAIDQAVREPSSSDLLFTAAFLVRHDDVEAFRQRVQDLAAAHPDLRLLCTGPWPPYHFVPGLDDVVAASPAREASHA